MDFSRRRAALHIDGCTGLPTVPDWAPLTFAEAQYRAWHQRIVSELEACRELWSEEDPNTRPGERAAAHVSALLAAEGAGVWISTTHPSEDDDHQLTPRWYASVIEAAARRFEAGLVPPPPAALAALLWPNQGDADAPWVTELGWTICPPHSAPQAVHADIVASCPGSDAASWFRRPGLGRFHHVAFKPGRVDHPTTEVLRGAFVDQVEDEASVASLERPAQ